MTLVSIIIPTFNKAPLVCDVVEHLDKQTFKDFEVVVVDDGSSDNTVKSLKILRRRTRHLKVKVLGTDLTDEFGMCQAINLGLHHASGRISLLVNDDIYLHPTCIQEHVIAQQQTNLRYAFVGPRFRSPPYDIGEAVSSKGRAWQKHVRTCTTGQKHDGYYGYHKSKMVSSNVSVCTRTICTIGGYNEFFTQYTGAIDRDLYYRLEKARVKVLSLWEAQAYAVRYSNQLYQATKWMRDTEFREGLNVSQWKRHQMRYSQRLEVLARQHVPEPIKRRRGR